MKKYVCLTLCIVFCSCQSKTQIETAALMASADDSVLLTAMEHKLTPNDLHRLDRHYPQTLDKLNDYQPLNSQDIINLVRAGVSDEVIIHEIGATRSTFYLTPEDEAKLYQAGVSRRVILAMKATVDDSY
ncbi:MAG: hypothetical protein P0S96_00040 [Simkaniaceae bacterium]|nr:hypothetical protein [Candidatus Sacchlamyda saccharinae]